MRRPISRRRFLGQLNCAAISSIPILNTLLNLKMAGSVAAASSNTSDFRALICLFLSGGIDTFNVLVPRGDTEYAEYKGIRSGVALPQNSLLPLTPAISPGLQLGAHPGLKGIQTLFNSGSAAFVTNVGTLIEPVTKDTYDSASLPLGLYSHADQVEQWHTSTPNVRSAKGWGGRMGDLLRSMNTLDTVSMNISLTGTNIWQSGENVFDYTISTDGAVPLDGYDPTDDNQWSPTPIRTRAIDSQLGFTYQHLLTEAFATKKRGAMDAYALFNSATGNVTLPSTVTFPDTDLGNQFQMIAKTVAGHGALGQTRQTFFIEYGGWDHHDDLINQQAAMLPEVDQAIKAFYDCLTAMGLQNSVTLFTASDFARTLTTDSAGTDHAWGGNHFVVGGAVKGNHIYGNYPPLYKDNPLDVGRGRIIPQIAVDLYFAELAMWLGVPQSSLPLVLPNIGTFFDVNGSNKPLGFMS